MRRGSVAVAALLGAMLVAAAAPQDSYALYTCYWRTSACGVGTMSYLDHHNSGTYLSYGLLMNTEPGTAIGTKWMWRNYPSVGPIYSTTTEAVFTRFYTSGNFSHWCENPSSSQLISVNCGWFYN
jgi:hypothetical protein